MLWVFHASGANARLPRLKTKLAESGRVVTKPPGTPPDTEDELNLGGSRKRTPPLPSTQEKWPGHTRTLGRKPL